MPKGGKHKAKNWFHSSITLRKVKKGKINSQSQTCCCSSKNVYGKKVICPKKLMEVVCGSEKYEKLSISSVSVNDGGSNTIK